MATLCDPADPEIPNQNPGFCETWSDGSSAIVGQCVAKANDSLNLFDAADADGDGDLDLKDVADYLNRFEPAPNLYQSPARIVSVACDFPESAARSVGICLSGPENPVPPSNCVLEGACTIEFSATVGPGDFLYAMCGAIDSVLPDADESYHTAWTDGTTPSVQECSASSFPGLNPFFVFDLDGDEDVDIADFAQFQNSFELPTGAD